MLIFLEVVFWELWENLSMIRKRVPGFALVFVCLLAKAQAPPSSVAASTYIDAGGAKVWFEECGSASLPRPAVVLVPDGLSHCPTLEDAWGPPRPEDQILRPAPRGCVRAQTARSPFVSPDALL